MTGYTRFTNGLALRSWWVIVFWGSISTGFAQELIVSPAHGQNAEQQQKDRTECAERARNETRIDPAWVQSLVPDPAAAAQGGLVRGGVAPATTGRNPGTAVHASPEELARRRQASAYGHVRALIDRAYGLCLEGRGYTVK